MSVSEILDLRRIKEDLILSNIEEVLSELSDGDILEVILEKNTDIDSLINSIKDEDYKILDNKIIGESYHLFIKIY